jgi:N-acetylmuramoyl-L-alanine amidase
MTIVALGAGHGGEFSGAEWGDFKEKDLNLRLCHKIQALLGRDPDIDIRLIRDSDRAMTWQERDEAVDADLVVSIHHNANRDPKVRGSEAYYFPGNSEAKLAAGVVLSALPKELEPFSVRAATKEKWPRARTVVRAHTETAILIEIGYMTNEDDRKIILSNDGANRIAYAIALGIRRAVNLLGTLKGSNNVRS